VIAAATGSRVEPAKLEVAVWQTKLDNELSSGTLRVHTPRSSRWGRRRRTRSEVTRDGSRRGRLSGLDYRLLFRAVFLPVFRAVFLPVFLAGILAPFFRASDRPMAIACSRLVTFPALPPRPERSVPCFSRRIALSTLLPAAFPYFRRPVFRRPVLRAAI
jgi:hypothetical protein